jgi:hypothetical protein
MPWDTDALMKARGIIFVAAGVLILVVYLISRLRAA